MTTTHSGSLHSVLLEFEYDTDRATIIEQSVRQEIGEIESDRTRASLDREGTTVALHVEADDLVALRAGLNSWCSLITVAERCSVPDG